ncbi:MAG: isopeptide-forming domain-containing fimbrial protein [Ruminococcus sp.]|nr:isopeptide-forming domain-containing fimbrial protein [Ruminococcus sp.]
MKKTLRSLTSVLLAVLMVMSLGITAFATEAEEYSITLNRVESDKAAHNYEAYQVFTVTKIKNGGAVAGVDWGTGVNGTELLKALKLDTTVVIPAAGTDPAKTMGELFADASSATAVAVVLDENSTNDTFVRRFADLVNSKLTTTKAATGTMAANAASVKLDVTEAGKGYYFVKDEDASGNNKELFAYTQFILQVLGKETLNVKEDVPTLNKVINEGDGVHANTASIGDTVPFRITATIPEHIDNYNKYYFVISDELCSGLTLLGSSIKVYAGNDELTNVTDYEANINSLNPGSDNFKITIVNAKARAGQTIAVEYNAVLNELAEIGETGNPNTAGLTYSNDPNHKYEGDPSDDKWPKDDDVMGKTPDVTTKTFTTALKLVKRNGETDPMEALAGAKFTISGQGVKAVVVKGEVFKADNTNGSWYMLKDGTFTQTAPTEEIKDQYDDMATTYSKVERVTVETAAENINKSAYSGNDGIITFKGLKAGTYTITEDAAPDGFNAVDPIEVVITGTLDDTARTCTWSAKKDGTEDLTADTAGNFEGHFAFDVVNNQGIILPGTGGIGTTVFYIVGGILILGACVLLVTKIRMKNKDK